MKRIIHTTNAPAAVGPYSQAVEAGNTLYVSGQIALDPASGKLIEGGIKEQTRQVMQNIGSILEAAGYSFDQVVKCTCLLSNMDNFKDMNEVYSGFFSADPPARAAYAVNRLPLDVLVEIETIAVK